MITLSLILTFILLISNFVNFLVMLCLVTFFISLQVFNSDFLSYKIMYFVFFKLVG